MEYKHSVVHSYKINHVHLIFYLSTKMPSDIRNIFSIKIVQTFNCFVIKIRKFSDVRIFM